MKGRKETIKERGIYKRGMTKERKGSEKGKIMKARKRAKERDQIKEKKKKENE